MAKKIEGYGLEEGNYWQEGKPTGSKANWQEATLIIGEKAFTESEVRAMLEDMRNDPLTDELQRSGVIVPIAAKHGIVLDPA